MTAVYNAWAIKKCTEELYLMALNIYAKLERKLTCAFKSDMKNLACFNRLKNSDYNLESKVEELNQIKSKQPVRQLYFNLEING